ncbi:MAG: XRE family transcriptional regulator [Actinobacteria bacterium]|nr:XRE family transcriptional regulator [Actinomycetota bacterium]
MWSHQRVVSRRICRVRWLSSTRPRRDRGVTQPRISDLARGKIDLFSIDTLVNMVTAAGLHLDMRVRAAS